MKKLAITIVCALATTVATFGQGLYSFNQAGAQLITTNNLVGNQIFGGPGTQLGATQTAGTSVGASTLFLFAVLDQAYSGTITSDTNVWDGTWSFSGITATNKSSGQPGTLGQQSNFAAPNDGSAWAAGNVTNQIILAGWSANLGSTWVGVSNLLQQLAANPANASTILAGIVGPAFFGVSSVGDVQLNNAGVTGNGTGDSLFGSAQPYGTPINSPFTLFALPVPEPATMALAGLGGLSLLLLRRRKS